MEGKLDELERDTPLVGPFLYTFTARIPVVLGIRDGFDTEVALPVEYSSEKDAAVFGRGPFVRIRAFNAHTADRQFCLANLPQALHYFYGGEYPFGEEHGPHRYEQWVSLETPAVFLAEENSADPAYAFHRCLEVLNLFLEAFALARDDDAVRAISARELRPIVVIGKLDLDGKWQLDAPMLMHPEGTGRSQTSRSARQHVDALNEALALVLNEEPFVRSRQWQMRAERRKYEGDAADAVISFQTAAETMSYELWALLLADEGVTTEEIQARRERGLPFKSLLQHELAPRLGGSWDLSSDRFPVGRYWARLYGLRNRIVHAGYLPHDGDADEAEAAFSTFDRFLDKQLKSRAKRFPEAARAKLEAQIAVLDLEDAASSAQHPSHSS